MPIYRLLKGSPYPPEHVALMTDAFEDVCRTLGLAQREDPFRDIVARAIIDCVDKGELNPVRLRQCAQEAIGQ